MASLKRLLNPDPDDTPTSRFEQTLKKPYLSANFYRSPSDFTAGPWHLSRELNSDTSGYVIERSAWEADNLRNATANYAGFQGSHDLSITSDPYTETTHIKEECVDIKPLTVDSSNVCFGMIYQAKVKAVGDMSQIDSSLNTSNVRTVAKHFIFEIRKEPDGIYLIFCDGTPMAVMNLQLFGVFNVLLENSRICLEALVLSSTLRETIARAVKAQDAAFSVNINVYGSHDEKSYIGRTLSKHKVWLQRPDWKQPDTIYDNPHVFVVPGMKDDSMLLTSPNKSKEIPSLAEEVDLQDTLKDVYSSLKRTEHLKHLEADARIKTTLLPHQQAGLDFMVQRENGPIPDDFQIWSPQTIDGQLWYVHKVAGVQSRTLPSDIGGGILADKMGMGKSLSILALLTRTLEDAHAWARDPDSFLNSGISSDKRLTSATLIVVPSALLINSWVHEVKIHLKVDLKIILYHGLKRHNEVGNMFDADIVLTTFHTLAADQDKTENPMSQIAWFRVVLDEAHVIRRQTTKLHRCVAELTAKSRWCLTGTPIQNQLDDIGALFAFLRIRPFENLGVFRKAISVPFDEKGQNRSKALRNLAVLLDSLCLRRTEDDLKMPECEETIKLIDLSPLEKAQYTDTRDTMNETLRQQAGQRGHESHFGMFQAQLQLRILCNHGTFQHHFSWKRKRNILDDQDEKEFAMGGYSSQKDLKCSLCHEVQGFPFNSTYSLPTSDCGHFVCQDCQKYTAEMPNKMNGSSSQCPICVGVVDNTRRNQNSAVASPWKDYFRPNGYSSKMTNLVRDLQQDLATSKSIVFSCWTTTLELISMHLRKQSIRFARIDGDCPLNQRQRILDDFATNDDLRVLIMTTGTGAFGLNLTAANRVFIVEPQWNPSVESQAVARAIRLGQGQRVTVTKYLTKDTVEQQMQSQQNRKLWMARMAGSSKVWETTTDLTGINESIEHDKSLALNG